MISRRIALLGLIVALAATLLTACGGGERRQVIQNKGSDTLVNVAQAWAEAAQRAEAVAKAARRQHEPLRLSRLAATFGLDVFEIDALLVCLAPEIDLRYGNLELKQLSVGQVKGTKAGGKTGINRY